ncbi:MAG: hypothetical protein IH597_07430 [Bacteroidales bacterium]|nr:hypothetical protein [Bacteroidales bacterium]
MHQLTIDFETTGHEPLTPAPTARQLRSMYYENMIQASTLNRELRRQDTAQRNAEVQAHQNRMNAWLSSDQKAEDQLDSIITRFEKGKPLSKNDLQILESLYLPDVLREILVS